MFRYANQILVAPEMCYGYQCVGMES